MVFRKNLSNFIVFFFGHFIQGFIFKVNYFHMVNLITTKSRMFRISQFKADVKHSKTILFFRKNNTLKKDAIYSTVNHEEQLSIIVMLDSNFIVHSFCKHVDFPRLYNW